MKVLVVAPYPRYSTYDVYTGHVAGFQANGCETFAFDYGKWLGYFNDFGKWAKRRRKALPELIEKVQVMAGESIYVAARVHQVDLVWMVAPVHIHPVIKALMMRDGITTAGYMTECPYEDERWVEHAQMFTHCFVNDRFSVDRFREVNPSSHYLPHAYDPDRHFPVPHEPEQDVAFIGSAFPRRRRFFDAVDWSGIDIRLFGMWGRSAGSPLAKFVTRMIVDNSQTVEIYRRTRIGLQLHRIDTWFARRRICRDPAQSLGPRSYELAGCKTFQISDHRPELDEVFGDTVPVFKTPEEMETLIRYYLKHDSERRELAERQHEAVKPCTFENRIKQALELIAA